MGTSIHRNCQVLWIDQSYGIFSSHVWMWELNHKKGWVLKNWCFRTVVLEKAFESPLDCKEIKPIRPKGNQSKYSLEGLMLKLKLQHFDKETTHWKRPWCWERLKATVEEGSRGMRWLDSITDSMDMNLSKFQEIVKDRGVWHAAVHGIAKSCTRLSDWTVTTDQGFPTAPKILLSQVLSACLWSHSLPNLLSLPHPTSIEATDIKNVEFVNPEWQRSVLVLSFAHCLAQSLKHAKVKSESVSHSVMSNSLWPQAL